MGHFETDWIVSGRVDLDGTHRAILETTESEFETPPLDTHFLKISSGGRSCAVIVSAVRTGAPRNRLFLDRYKLRHLGVNDDDRVQGIFFRPEAASAITCSAATPISKRDQVRLIGKCFSRGEKSAIFTFSGDARPYTISTVVPDDLVLITPATVIGEGVDDDGRAPISYRDIGGLGSEIRLIRESIEYPFRYRDVFAHLGVAPPRGIILHGPPGTGKTLIARALAAEIGANYYTISGPEIYSRWYGSSEQSLRNIFNEAVKNAPSIVLIDELDSLVPRRDTVQGDQEQRIVATFLTQMDGLKDMKDVVVVGTTNRINEIDPALRRSGRFEKEIYIGVPDHAGRREILKIHTKRMPLGDNVDLARVAELSNGYTGADLTSLCREAALASLRRALPDDGFSSEGVSDVRGVRVEQADFINAFKVCAPSAGREYNLDVPKVAWEDVGGLETIQSILMENLVFSVKHREAFEKAGVRAAGGILLYGPPGTGKTLLARAVASCCELNFIGIKASDIRDRWVGGSESRIRNVFQRARLMAPCVIFFDEIDALASRRGNDPSGISDAIVNQLLSEMDGLEDFGQIFVMGATNRIEAVDPAVLRPGRFDYHLEIPLPSVEGRQKIFEIHLRSRPCSDVSCESLAAMTEGFSGAHIAEVCREAAWHSLRAVSYDAERVSIRMADLEPAISRMFRSAAGEKK